VFAGGFSFGAEVVPVSLRLWTPADRRVIAGLVMIAPSTSASFEINPLDWLRRPTANAATLVAPAVREDGIPALCVAGADEDDTPCPALSDSPAVRVVRLPGSHHFNGEYGVVADAVAQFIQSSRPGGERRP
jgi:type IV secretory pathway VirJ component